jgi:quinol monooxygenase YgiN
MTQARIPDPTLMARLQLSVKGVDWAASLVAHRQHEQLEGEWSAHQHVYHLLGNEGVFQERIRRIINEDRPVFERWDSQEHMRAHTPEPGIAALAERFMAERAATVELLKPLSADQWFRTGTWPDGRVIDLAWLAEKVLWHALDHFAFLLDLHGELEPLQAPAWRQGAS